MRKPKPKRKKTARVIRGRGSSAGKPITEGQMDHIVHSMQQRQRSGRIRGRELAVLNAKSKFGQMMETSPNLLLSIKGKDLAGGGRVFYPLIKVNRLQHGHPVRQQHLWEFKPPIVPFVRHLRDVLCELLLRQPAYFIMG